MVDMWEYSDDGRKIGHIIAEDFLSKINSMIQSGRESGLSQKDLTGIVVGFCEMTNANLEFDETGTVIAVEDPI